MENPRLAYANSYATPSSSSSGSRPSSSRTRPGYGFIRNTDTWGVNSIPWDQLAAAGLLPAFAANDPHLAQAMEAAKQKGIHAGVWIPAGGEGAPEQYAQRIVDLYKKYGANVLPNIEFTGKGGRGSDQWEWNQRMVNELTRLGVPPNLAVTVLPPGTNPSEDFNYEAYTRAGIPILAEAFGADSGKDLYDPDLIRSRLRQAGVSDDMMDVLLSPTQSGAGRGSVYTIDDLTPDQLKALATGGAPPTTEPAVPTSGSYGDTAPTDTSGATTESAADYPTTSTTPDDAVSVAHTHRPDSQNPAAIAYAKTRLAQLAHQGITADRYGLGHLDPTAQWRALSTIVGARQAIKGGHGENYHVPSGTPGKVAAYVNQLLHPSRAKPGVYTPANRRLGPMQRAIHSAAGIRYLRSIAGRG